MQKTAQSWFMGGPSSSSDDQQQKSTSLLADWNAYAASQVSSDSPSPAGAGAASFDLEAAVPTTTDKVAGTFDVVSKRVKDLRGNFQSSSSSVASGKSMMYFGILVFVGAFFVFIAFTMFFPILVLVPQKFAICFSIGSAFIIGSLFALRGPKNQLEHMFARERLPSTLGLVGAMLGTVYVSMVLHSYTLSMLFSLLQVIALSYYVISYFPGGSTGLKFLSSTLTSSMPGHSRK